MDERQLSIDDENVLIAVRALGDMRNGAGTTPPKSSSLSQSPESHYPSQFRSYNPSESSTQATPSLSTASSSSTSTISETPIFPPDPADDVNFVTRVAGLPIISTTLQAYKHGKASSRVVKYGAEMMEGTVKMMTRPVIDRLPVNQLDEFASRQLDRFGKYGGARTESPTRIQVDDDQPIRRSTRGRKHLWIEDSDPMRDPDGGFSRESSVGAPSSEAGWSATSDVSRTTVPLQIQQETAPSGQEVQVVSRSKWQAVLLEAGGIGAAVSEESMKRLKYCLQWLQYATAHIDQQIVLLQTFIASITPNLNGASTSTSPPTASTTDIVPFQTLQTLAQVKKELVATIRQVVDVVSKYAGGALPEQAKASVRTFILMLPERWASAARLDESSPDPTFRSAGTDRGMTASTAAIAASRVLTLATESLDMMRSVTGVFKESMDRAEAWIDRLQQLGLQRQHAQRGLPIPDWGVPGAVATTALPTSLGPRVPLTNPFASPPYTTPSSPLTSTSVSLRSLSLAHASPAPAKHGLTLYSDDSESECETETESVAKSDDRAGNSKIRKRKKRRANSNSGDDEVVGRMELDD